MSNAYQGTDLIIYVPKVRDATGAAVDLTGASLACSVLLTDGTRVNASATSVDAATGTAQAQFSRTLTALWPAASGSVKYDCVITLANGLRHVVGTGQFRVLDPVTPTP